MTASSIPLADAPALRVVATRTRIARLALAAMLLASGVAAVLLARDPRVSQESLLPQASGGIVVLDLSASVETGTLRGIYSSLTQLAQTRGGRFGLVIFSGSAYEALPPGTPARELTSVARFFKPQNPAAGAAGDSRSRPLFPRNPWAQTFALGTSISTGLDLARSIIVGNHLDRRSVVLISDLRDDPADLPVAAEVARSYRKLGIAFHVVGLSPSLGGEQFFEHLVGPGGSFTHAQLGVSKRLTTHAGFPASLAVVGGVLAVLLAVNELWGAPLRWGRRSDLEEVPA